MMTMITLAIVAAIGVFTLALVFVPGMNASMFFGIARGVATVFGENRKERVAARRKWFRRNKEPDTKVEEKSTNVLDTDQNVGHTSGVEETTVVDSPTNIRDRLRDRRGNRRTRRRDR